MTRSKIRPPFSTRSARKSASSLRDGAGEKGGDVVHRLKPPRGADRRRCSQAWPRFTRPAQRDETACRAAIGQAPQALCSRKAKSRTVGTESGLDDEALVGFIRPSGVAPCGVTRVASSPTKTITRRFASPRRRRHAAQVVEIGLLAPRLRRTRIDLRVEEAVAGKDRQDDTRTIGLPDVGHARVAHPQAEEFAALFRSVRVDRAARPRPPNAGTICPPACRPRECGTACSTCRSAAFAPAAAAGWETIWTMLPA